MSIDALIQLENRLDDILTKIDIPAMEFGNPQAVFKATALIKKTFVDVTPASPPQNRAYQAALKFLQNMPLNASEFDFIAGGIHFEIKELNNTSVIASSRFNELLKHYSSEIKKDDMWPLSWYWLLTSYFSLKADEQTDENRKKLQLFLNRTHSHFTSEVKFAPPWVKALKSHNDVLSNNPCKKYAKQVLDGDRSQINILKDDLSIPGHSWFWHELTLSVVEDTTKERDDIVFKKYISKLINYIEEAPAYRDQAIELILKRYYRCADKSHHKALCDYVIQPKIWGSPKLKDIGLTTKWRNVNDNIWRMVRSWVTKENLRIFFQILAGRNSADKGRFEFWLQYVDQIGFIKLVFGEETKRLRRHNKEIDKLFKEEEGVYAILKSSNSSLDAFIMQIGEYTFVEFSQTSNAAFIYENAYLPFDLKARHLNDKTRGDGLKSAQHNKIIHNPDWQPKVKSRLMAECNIYPD